MKDILNERVKHREGFRPFAPSVLEEDAAEFFELSGPSPFMLLVAKIHPDKQKLIISSVMSATGTLKPIEKPSVGRWSGQ